MGIVIGFKGGLIRLTLSDLPTDMKRGFLNSKKVKDQPLYDNGASTAELDVSAPPKHLGDSATASVSRTSLIYMYCVCGSDSASTVLSGPKMLSEPIVGSSKSRSQYPGSDNDDLYYSILGRYSCKFTYFGTVCSRPHSIS